MPHSESTMSNNTEADHFDREDVEAVAACLGDDAAQLREENGEDERAVNMDRAASMLTWMLLTHPAYSAGAQPAAQTGWKLVPVMPDAKMLDAGAMRIAMNAQYVATAEAKAGAVWRDMLSASPHPAPQQPDARDALVRELVEALRDMEAEKSEYMIRNKLGDPAVEDTNRRARAVLAKVPGV